MACTSSSNGTCGSSIFIGFDELMSSYSKPHLTYAQQLDLLVDRGMFVSNQAKALNYLERIGYYRLSAYSYPFRKIISVQENGITKNVRSDAFLEGAEFSLIANLYVFDKKLRLLTLDAIERIEVALRVDIAYLLGKYDLYAHLNPKLLHGNFAKKNKNSSTAKTKHQEWLEKYQDAVKRSREEFVEHFRSKYDAKLPIWCAIELWDFGMLSIFYSGMKVADKNKIAAKYGFADFTLLESWLRTVNYVRNVAAHHSRLWNRDIVNEPKLPKLGLLPELNHLIPLKHAHARYYAVACLLRYLLKKINPSSSWHKRLEELLQSFPSNHVVDIKHMGFPADWHQLPLWES